MRVEWNYIYNLSRWLEWKFRWWPSNIEGREREGGEGKREGEEREGREWEGKERVETERQAGREGGSAGRDGDGERVWTGDRFTTSFLSLCHSLFCYTEDTGVHLPVTVPTWRGYHVTCFVRHLINTAIFNMCVLLYCKLNSESCKIIVSSTACWHGTVGGSWFIMLDLLCGVCGDTDVIYVVIFW